MRHSPRTKKHQRKRIRHFGHANLFTQHERSGENAVCRASHAIGACLKNRQAFATADYPHGAQTSPLRIFSTIL